MISNNSLEWKSENLPEYSLEFVEEQKNQKVVINFYPRSVASGVEENHYFGVISIAGKIYPASSLDELPQLIRDVLNTSDVQFTPF